MSNIREAIRISLTTKVEALKASFVGWPLAIEYANGEVVNTAIQTKPYLKVHIIYQDGEQLELAYNPNYRLIGTILVEACFKEGTGTKAANILLNHFYPALQMRDTMPPLRTMAARFSSKPVTQGWAAESALIPFWADSTGY